MKAKRITALALAAAMGVTALTGCSTKSVDADAVVATMADDKEVRLGVANFMARYMQSTYDSFYLSYFGEKYWSQDMSGEGKTMEEDTKEQVLDELKTYYALAAHMEDYDVEITKKDKKNIEKTAKEFIKDNEEKTTKAMTATQQDVEEYLYLITVQQRMYDKIIADADTKVSDEEAAQRTFSYVTISTAGTTNEDGENTAYSDEELKGLKNKAQALAESKAGEFETLAKTQELTVETFSYKAGEEDEEMDQAVLAEADKLKEGEVSGVIETEDAYYVIRLDSEYDKEATETKKKEIIEERQSDLYEQVCDKYTKDFVFKVDKDVWKSVKFDELFKAKEEESTEEK